MAYQTVAHVVRSLAAIARPLCSGGSSTTLGMVPLVEGNALIMERHVVVRVSGSYESDSVEGIPDVGVTHS